MATSFPIVSKNAKGRYYVDESCIYCELCVETAPINFAYDDEDGVAFIQKQPDCDSEHELLLEVIRLCPTVSIGDKIHPHEELIDDLGLGSGTTPKSLIGGIAQVVARWFSRE